MADETEFLGWLHSIDSTILGSDAERLDLVESGRLVGLKARQPLLFPDAQLETDILIDTFLPFVELVSCLLVKSV
jgi:hypothetical protein